MSLYEVRLWGRTVGALELLADAGVAFEWEPTFAGAAGAVGIEPAPDLIPVLPATVHRSSDGRLHPFFTDGMPGRWARGLHEAVEAHRRRRTTARHESDAQRGARLLAALPPSARGALRLRADAAGTASAARQAGAEPVEPFALAAMAALSAADPGAFARRLSGRTAHPAAHALLRGATSSWPGPAIHGLWDPAAAALHAPDAEAAPPQSQPVIVALDCDAQDASGNQARARLAYHRLAQAAGILTTPAQLLNDGSRRHLIARRSDRAVDGSALHVVSLATLLGSTASTSDARDEPEAATSDEADVGAALALVQRVTGDVSAALDVMRRLALASITGAQGLGADAVDLQMLPNGAWRLAPAAPTAVPAARRTSAGRPSRAPDEDAAGRAHSALVRAAAAAGIKPRAARSAIAGVHAAVERWPEFAAEAELPRPIARAIAADHQSATLA